jgi:hypothetical protein
MYSDKALTLMQFSDGTLQDAMNCFHKVTLCVCVVQSYNRYFGKVFSEWVVVSC